MIGLRGPWMFGVAVIAVLIFLHWLAYRIGDRRRNSRGMR